MLDLPRLFVYHCEVETFKVVKRGLLKAITDPAVTWLEGFSPRGRLRPNCRWLRIPASLFVNLRRLSLSRGSMRGRRADQSAGHSRGAGLQSPRLPQPWPQCHSRVYISTPSSPPM
jgi:hypothetical protein